MPTEKIRIGEMMVDSDALTSARQHVQLFYLPAAGDWRHKFSVEQRLVGNGDNKDSAPTTCIRFQEFGPLNAFMKDLFLPGVIDFGLRDGLQLDWLEHDLIQSVKHAVERERLKQRLRTGQSLIVQSVAQSI